MVDNGHTLAQAVNDRVVFTIIAEHDVSHVRGIRQA